MQCFPSAFDHILCFHQEPLGLGIPGHGLMLQTTSSSPNIIATLFLQFNLRVFYLYCKLLLSLLCMALYDFSNIAKKQGIKDLSIGRYLITLILQLQYCPGQLVNKNFSELIFLYNQYSFLFPSSYLGLSSIFYFIGFFYLGYIEFD